MNSSGDTPDVLLDGSGAVIQKYITLPGDVIVTIKPGSASAGATTYSLPNIHGDVYATVNADGALNSVFATGPFGETLPAQPAQPSRAVLASTNPKNTSDGATWNYIGQYQKLTEVDLNLSGGIIQMGARVYLPKLGRFITVDPIEGGTDNNYVYPTDPVNELDLNGKIAPLVAIVAWQLGRIAVQQTVKIAAQHMAKQAAQQVIKKATVEATKKATQKAVPKIVSNARGYKSPKITENIGKFTRTTWSVNAEKAGAPARAVYTKIQINNVTRTFYKDAYSKYNKLMHRKYKVCKGRPC